MHYFPKVLYYFSLASSQPFNTHPYISFSFSSCCWKREKIVSSSTWEEKKKTLPSPLMDICKSVENCPEKIWPSKISKYLDPWWSLGITIKLFQFLCSILKKIQSVHQMNTLFLQKWSNPKPMSRLREFLFNYFTILWIKFTCFQEDFETEMDYFFLPRG